MLCSTNKMYRKPNKTMKLTDGSILSRSFILIGSGRIIERSIFTVGFIRTSILPDLGREAALNFKKKKTIFRMTLILLESRASWPHKLLPRYKIEDTTRTYHGCTCSEIPGAALSNSKSDGNSSLTDIILMYYHFGQRPFSPKGFGGPWRASEGLREPKRASKSLRGPQGLKGLREPLWALMSL